MKENQEQNDYLDDPFAFDQDVLISVEKRSDLIEKITSEIVKMDIVESCLASKEAQGDSVLVYSVFRFWLKGDREMFLEVKFAVPTAKVKETIRNKIDKIIENISDKLIGEYDILNSETVMRIIPYEEKYDSTYHTELPLEIEYVKSIKSFSEEK